MQACQFLTYKWRGQLQTELIFIVSMASSFGLQNVTFCRFIPYCSSDVWSGTGPAPTPPPRPQRGRQKEKVTNANASTFFSGSFKIQIWASLGCKKKDNSSNFMFASNQFDVCFCYQLSTPSWDPWSSARSSKTPFPKELSRPRLSCCLAQGEFALSLTLWCRQLLDKSPQPL